MKIPRDCNGGDLARALRKLGYAIARQSGSHMILTTVQCGEHHVTVPNHQPLKVGTLHDILKGVAAHRNRKVEDLIRELAL